MTEQNHSLKMEVDSSLSNTVMVAMAVRGLCDMTSLTPVEVSRIELCLVEVLNNVIEHAYDYSSGHKIEVVVDISSAMISITVSDWGKPIPQSKLEVTSFLSDDDAVDAQELEVGGRGIFIIKSLMDDVQYLSEGGKNSVVMAMTIHG